MRHAARNAGISALAGTISIISPFLIALHRRFVYFQ